MWLAGGSYVWKGCSQGSDYNWVLYRPALQISAGCYHTRSRSCSRSCSFPHMTKQANTAMKSWRAWLAGERRRGPREERRAYLDPLAPRPWAAQHVGSIAIRPDAGERPLLSLKIGIIQGTKCHSANYVTVPAEGRVIAIARGQDQGVEVSSRGDGVGQRGGTPNDKTARTLHATRALALIPMERETVGAAPGQQQTPEGLVIVAGAPSARGEPGRPHTDCAPPPTTHETEGEQTIEWHRDRGETSVTLRGTATRSCLPHEKVLHLLFCTWVSSCRLVLESIASQ